MDGLPPKFKPFTKTRVVLSLEPTPMPIDQKGDLTAHVPKPFVTGMAGEVEVAEGDAGAVATEQPVEPQMFGKRKREKKIAVPGEGVVPATTAAAVPGALPDILLRVKVAADKKTKAAAKVPGEAKLYSRFDVLSREQQSAEVAKLPEALQAEAKGLLDVETENPYAIEPVPEVFAPTSRRGFGSFIINKYGPIFPKGAERELNVATCAKKGDEGVKEVKIYHYQAFIREYLRFETPYRGLLVYHGLGSGKTCSAIAGAEALFGTRGMKIIVMTPYSLRDNFISEINFCGFKHFRLQNHWTSLSLLPGASPEPGMVKLFAQNVYGVPESYFGRRGRGRAQLTRIWVPDFEQAPNFNSLSPEEKDEIQTQLKATIENRIKFINYNGITASDLKTMVCSTPDVFDNAVIVVDEVHNLTRLIQGSLEKPFTKAQPREVLSPERKALPLCGMTSRYSRGYLFYRLFMDAKNTKVIGLSGTPLINFPEELGILMNILHGPIKSIEFVVTVEAMREVKDVVEKVVRLNENLDTVSFDVSEGSISVTVTRLPEEFTKVLDDQSEVLGIRRRDPGQAIPSLEEVWASLAAALKAEKVAVKSSTFLKAQELLPSWDTPFRGAFLQEDGITLKNVRVLQKRIRGLISYYRGIQGNVMPKVIKDEIVGVPLTGYSLKIYNKLRNQEIQVEMSKPKPQAGMTGSDAVWAEINEIASMKTPSNYRMSSRQACNFVFPEGLTRPRPRNLDEQDVETGKDRDKIIEGDVEGKVAGREESDAASVSDDDEAAGAAGKVLNAKQQAEAYKQAIKVAKQRLREMGETHLKLDGPPERNLKRYSPKFAAMLQKINDLKGSSLVYSQFLEMEGIGIFGICMEANGYVPIEIIAGADGKLKFSERTATSLLKGPKANESRYIEFTGTGTKEQRGAAVNVFNARLDKLSPAMEKVLKDGGWSSNLDGALCRVFCITSAGAEGLSLKAVRGVHIMEPYWNTVRTQQVKGRAVRICSHMELPEDEQNVEIFTYCTTIPEEAILAQAVDKTLERSDSYPAKVAELLGVPVPAAVKAGTEVPEGMFFKVEAVPEAEVPTGAQVAAEGPIKFYVKLENEYRGFSNFAPSPVVLGGKRYPTAEHYVQAMKFPDDPVWQETIRVSANAAKARQLAMDTGHPVRADWDTVKEGIFLEALRAKFQQNRGLLEQLKGTGVRPLIEASPDPFWGEGRTGKGKNRMGKLLEQVREELREYVVPAAVGDEVAPTDTDFTALDDEEAAAEAADAEAVEVPAPTEEVMLDELLPQKEEVQKGGADDDRVIILTSDQKVLLISLRKERVIGALQTLMKTVSVDCSLNFKDNNDGTFRCLSLGDSIGDFAYHPDLNKDIKETEARFKTEAPGLPLTVAPVAPPAAIAATIEGTAASMAAPIPVAAPIKPKPKKITYRKKDYYYKVNFDTAKKPLGYLFFAIEDPDLISPVGYVQADPKGLPKGDIGPVPEEAIAPVVQAAVGTV
jgi:hypothetical protein